MTASRIVVGLTALCVPCFLVTTAGAQPTEIRMSVEGVPGDDGAGGSAAWLHAFAHSITVPTDLQTGRPTGTRQHQPVSVTKWVNAGTPMFAQRLASSEPVGSVQFDFYRSSQTGTIEVYYSVLLENARVVYQGIEKPWVGSASIPTYARPAEHLYFIYENIRWTYVDGGVEYSDSWGGPIGKTASVGALVGLGSTIRDRSELEIVDGRGGQVDSGLARGRGEATLSRIFTSLPAGEYRYRLTRDGVSAEGAVVIPVERRAREE